LRQWNANKYVYCRKRTDLTHCNSIPQLVFLSQTVKHVPVTIVTLEASGLRFSVDFWMHECSFCTDCFLYAIGKPKSTPGSSKAQMNCGFHARRPQKKGLLDHNFSKYKTKKHSLTLQIVDSFLNTLYTFHCIYVWCSRLHCAGFQVFGKFTNNSMPNSKDLFTNKLVVRFTQHMHIYLP
jgi:hypothetical protein